MKRFFLILGVVCLMVSPLFAGAKPEKSGGTEQIRVVTFFAGSDSWVPAWKEAIEEYQKLNPNVKIVDESQPTSGANDVFRTKINTEIAAKTPADVLLFFNGADGQAILDSGLYADWTQYMKDDPNWSKNLLAGPMASGRTDSGLQYCIPFIGFYEGLIYNKDLFDKYNLKEPTSWQNILDCINTFKANGIYPFATALNKPSYLLESLIIAQVGAAGQAKILDDSWAPALNAVATLFDRGAFPPDTLSSTEDMVRQLFVDGKAAMMVNGSWFLNNVKAQPGMRVTAFPALPGGSGDGKAIVAGFGSGWYISKAAAARSQETLKFVKWITTPATTAKFLAIGGVSAIALDPTAKTTPVEQSGSAMLGSATATRPAADSQMVREAWLAITEQGIPRLVSKQATALELLANARQIEASAR